jgi:HK97 family phage portal protein
VIVQSFGELQSVAPTNAYGLTSDLPATANYAARYAYSGLYESQPNIRIPIDFLAGNVAQLGIHVFRRIDANDRERLPNHQLSQWLAKPNPATTQYRLFESLMGDLGVYRNAYWLKVRYTNDDGARAIGLVRLPPQQMTVSGGLLPTAFCWTGDAGQKTEFPLSEIVYFNGYNPCNPRMGLSQLDTLASIVNEEAAAAKHREYYWRNASRHEGVIERPATAPKWTDPQKKAFREQWQRRYAGAGNSGLVAVLEDGMAFKPTAFSPRDSEYIQGMKQRREITAAQFNVPQPSIGILDHATFSNIKEQHKQLYQDSLGPTLEMIVQEIERQLLIECDDQDRVYIEFNIAAKLAGSFEEQAAAIQALVGRPVMTPNEGRGRLNLPSIKDDPTADQLAPQQGGPSNAVVPPVTGSEGSADPVEPGGDADPGSGTDPYARADVRTVLSATRARQRAALGKLPPAERSSAFFAQMDRWQRELVRDLRPLVGADEAARVALTANVALFTELEADEP